ncbi:MAG: hypothetical protein COY69_00010 [Candidatus Magasanikbacteria bacterium CG_4_10_14_0_8_um_filter_32_14]|uniref:Bacterial Ig-like domain-containing protein n=1 Tax=Candidatus Magasanikbacteria bacterium CG_4_10_14_0_8_um_filter_32_14 TaxID=1974640 RepID=A0A2M7RBP7_9BACT|nr:MAG: hypothetical protein COY69_00010 [Candidatus Magasanikbacteria bacterium CG_4_10_14_0_8_um_filter_32_14]
MRRQLSIFFILLLSVFFLPKIILATSGTILVGHSYAWSNNVGYLNFRDTIVGDSLLTGYVWSQNSGWIKMNPSNGGVANDGQGNLSGFAWGESLGWINFSGVNINSSGIFTGTASGDLIGTLTFDCTNCDVETDWRATPGGGGGGGGGGVPPVQNLPTGSIQINNGEKYSNNFLINLQFVTDYVDTYAISNANDFAGASYLSIVSSTQFSLPSGDGTKTVYVSFKNQYGTYVASDSIILDTIAPAKPIIMELDDGVVNGARVRPPKLSGTAEANSQIIFTKILEDQQTLNSFYLADVDNYFTTVDAQGNWTFIFDTLFEPGNYAISAIAKDVAENISDSSDVVHLVIPVDKTLEQNMPNGSIRINNDAQYSNNINTTINFVTDYTDTYAISNTNDFAGASYLSIVSSTQFSLPSGDGTKTVYISFKNQYGTYVVSDSIILDTIAPDKPTISQIDLGIENGVRVRPPKLSGTAEANSQIIFIKSIEDQQTLNSFYLVGVYNYFTLADAQGNWTFTFDTLFEPGNYVISATTQDAAENLSKTSAVIHLVIPVDGGVSLPEGDPGDGSGGTGTSSSTIPILLPTSLASSTPIATTGTIFNNVKKTVSNVTESITETVKNIGNNIAVISKQTSQVVANISTKVAETVVQVVNNPQVDTVNEQIVAPIVITTAVVNVATSGFGILNIINFLQVFFGQFFLLFRRTKQKKWGVLYNSFTKKPIDLALIRLIDLNTNKVVRSVVTDMEGRYILSVKPGNYKIIINKSGYGDFSKHLMNAVEDSAFINLYHGENIKVTDESEFNYNIPLDPIEENKNYLQIIKDKTHNIRRLILSIIGLVFSVISFVISPVWWVGILVILQFLSYMIIRRFSYSKLPSSFGVITMYGQEKALANVAVRVFDATFNKLIETTVSDRKGRYAVLLGPSKYYATYEKEKYEKKKSPLLDFSSSTTEGIGGILVRDEFLERKFEKGSK